jgi:hypothetical protein
MWACTLLLAACCGFTHGAMLLLEAGCALVVGVGACWSTYYR